MKRTMKATAWLSQYADPELLLGRDDRLASGQISFASTDKMEEVGWVNLGEATITIDLPDRDQLVDFKIETLRAEVRRIQAEATNRITAVERKINTLLALPRSQS